MKNYLLLAVAALAIAGCSPGGGKLDRQQERQRWEQRQQALAGMQSWNMNARAVLTLKAEAYNIGIRWRRDRDNFMMLLQAPFGQGVIRIDSRPGAGYRLTLPDSREFYDQDPEQLLEQTIGWSLPIGGLEYWIRGLPRPDSAYSHRLGEGGRARKIGQDGWSIEYLDYFDDPAPAQLPRRIHLQREDLALKLVIEYWQPTAAEAAPDNLFPVFD